MIENSGLQRFLSCSVESAMNETLIHTETYIKGYIKLKPNIHTVCALSLHKKTLQKLAMQFCEMMHVCMTIIQPLLDLFYHYLI